MAIINGVDYVCWCNCATSIGSAPQKASSGKKVEDDVDDEDDEDDED